jgi:hypothetical protein
VLDELPSESPQLRAAILDSFGGRRLIRVSTQLQVLASNAASPVQLATIQLLCRVSADDRNAFERFSASGLPVCAKSEKLPSFKAMLSLHFD